MSDTKVEVCCNGVFSISAKHCYKICDFKHEVHIDETKNEMYAFTTDIPINPPKMTKTSFFGCRMRNIVIFLQKFYMVI